MTTGKIDLPDVHFEGSSTKNDWRDLVEDDPDDEELEETPESVIMMLGFDPKDIVDDDGDVQSEQQTGA